MVRKLVIPTTLAVTVLGLSACYEEPECHDSCKPSAQPPADGGVAMDAPATCPEDPDEGLYPRNEGCPPGCERHYCFA